MAVKLQLVNYPIPSNPLIWFPHGILYQKLFEGTLWSAIASSTFFDKLQRTLCSMSYKILHEKWSMPLVSSAFLLMEAEIYSYVQLEKRSILRSLFTFLLLIFLYSSASFLFFKQVPHPLEGVIISHHLLEDHK